MRPVIHLRAYPDGKPQLSKDVALPGDFMTKIDLKDAYLSVPVHKSSLKFLQFIWKGACYQFKALPFGLCRIFTTFKTCCCIPEEEGLSSPYIVDDFLLLAATVGEAVKNT